MTELQIPIPLAAATAAAYVAWLLWILLVRRRVLASRDAAITASMVRSSETAMPHVADTDRLAAAGLSMTPTTFNLIRLAAAAAGLVLALAFRLPVLVMLAATAAGYFAPVLWLEQRRKTRELSIDDDLPAALSGLAATLAMSQNLSEALEAAADAISPPGDPRPRLLAQELRRTAAAASSSGNVEAALIDLQQRSPSPTLAMTAFNLRVYAAAGGGKFTRQIVETATRVRNMLEGRKRARAYAGSAQSVVLLILGLTVFLGVLGFQDPSFAAYYRSGTGAIVLIGVVAVMAGAYWVMNQMIEDVG
jgi:Flp pilus assembly protein TadB